MLTYLWLMLSFAALLALGRFIHARLQWLGQHLWPADPDRALWLYAGIFLPGVALHELSHYGFALALGVPTGKVSLLPERHEGKLRLGYVQVAETDALRSSLVGVAPLITGIAALMWLGANPLGAAAVTLAFVRGGLLDAWGALAARLSDPVTWLWLYLTFAVANSMMPSESDRRAWPAALAVIIGVALIVAALGLTDWLTRLMQKPLAVGVEGAAYAFTLAVLVNLLMAPLAWGVERWARQRRARRITKCVICGQPAVPGQKHCRECARMVAQATSRPTSPKR